MARNQIKKATIYGQNSRHPLWMQQRLATLVGGGFIVLVFAFFAFATHRYVAYELDLLPGDAPNTVWESAQQTVGVDTSQPATPENDVLGAQAPQVEVASPTQTTTDDQYTPFLQSFGQVLITSAPVALFVIAPPIIIMAVLYFYHRAHREHHKHR